MQEAPRSALVALTTPGLRRIREALRRLRPPGDDRGDDQGPVESAAERMLGSDDVTIVAVLVGGTLLGVVGAILAVPVAAALQFIATEVILPAQDAS